MTACSRILVVEAAREFGPALARQLAGHEVLTAVDGESAWQTLVLDPHVVLVVADVHMARLDGCGLLERLRGSRLTHLQQMPVILIAPEADEHTEARARSLGVTDWLVRAEEPAAVLLARLQAAVVLAEPRVSRPVHQAELAQSPDTGLYTRKYLELQAAQAVSHSARHGMDVSVMVLGFDGYEALTQRIGAEAALAVTHRFAKTLSSRIRQEDSLGHFGDGRFAVVSPGTSVSACQVFAERIRQAVETARLTFEGQAVALTVSVGLAGVPVDRVTSAGGLLDTALQRMQQAMQAGGNRIQAAGGASAQRGMSVTYALQLLEANRPGMVVPQLEGLLAQLMPLLVLADKEFDLALPLARLEQVLGERNNK